MIKTEQDYSIEPINLFKLKKVARWSYLLDHWRVDPPVAVAALIDIKINATNENTSWSGECLHSMTDGSFDNMSALGWKSLSKRMLTGFNVRESYKPSLSHSKS